MKLSVKDVQDKARVVKRVLEIRCEPYRYGEIIKGDRYSFGQHSLKNRVGKYRVVFKINEDRSVKLLEIAKRAEVYEHGAIQNRQQRRKA